MSKFKVGDRVVVKNPEEWQRYQDGDIGTVVDPNKDRDIVIVKVGDRNPGRKDGCWVVRSRDLEFAPTKRRTEVEPGDERVGDIAICNGNEFGVELLWGQLRVVFTPRGTEGLLVSDARKFGFTIYREKPEVKLQNQVVCLDGVTRPLVYSNECEWTPGTQVWVSDRKPIKFEGDE